MLSIDDGDEGMLWRLCHELQVRYGSNARIDEVGRIGTRPMEAVLGSQKIREKIVKFGGDQYKSRPETATLAILQQALGGIAGVASHSTKARAKRKKTVAQHKQVESKRIPGKKVSKIFQDRAAAANSDKAKAKRAKSHAKFMERRAETYADPNHELRPTLLEAVRSNTKCPYSERYKRECVHCAMVPGRTGKVGATGRKYSLCSKCTRLVKRMMDANNFENIEW